jgi:hypothetical protein
MLPLWLLYPQIKHWLVPNSHEYISELDDETYREGEIVFPGLKANIGFGLTALEGQLFLSDVKVTMPRYTLYEDSPRASSVDEHVEHVIRYEGYPKEWADLGKVSFRLPSDEGLYGKLIPVHYSVSVRHAVLVGDGAFTWERKRIEGTIMMMFASKAQALAVTRLWFSFLAIQTCLGVIFVIAIWRADIQSRRLRTATALPSPLSLRCSHKR